MLTNWQDKAQNKQLLLLSTMLLRRLILELEVLPLNAQMQSDSERNLFQQPHVHRKKVCGITSIFNIFLFIN
jgi:hypothetical protein